MTSLFNFRSRAWLHLSNHCSSATPIEGPQFTTFASNTKVLLRGDSREEVGAWNYLRMPMLFQRLVQAPAAHSILGGREGGRGKGKFIHCTLTVTLVVGGIC